jgi:hypothetical protein
MKYLVLSATIMGLLILSPVVSADGRYGRGYDRHYDYGFYGRDRFRGYGYYRNRHPVRYRNYYRRGGSYWNFSFGRGYRHSHFDGGALLGGLVLGSIIGHNAASSRYDRYPAAQTSRIRVIDRSPVVNRTSGPQRRLLRDLEGRCYEINVDGAGNETRIELDPSTCNF